MDHLFPPSLLRLLSVLIFLCFLEPLHAAGPCPTAPPSGSNAFTQQQGWSPQPQWAEDWYFLTGSLCVMDSERAFDGEDFAGCANPLGFQSVTILFNGTGANGASILVAQQHLVVSYTQHFLSVSNGIPVFTNFLDAGLPQPGQPSDTFNFGFTSTITKPAGDYVTVSYGLEAGTAGSVGSAYRFYAKTGTFSLDLSLVSQSASMYHGNGGYYHLAGAPPNICGSSYYVSMPRMWTSGRITLNGVSYLVKGSSWLDNQWLNPGAGGYQKGWIWSWIPLGRRRVMLHLPHLANNVQLYNSTTVEIGDVYGNIVYGTITQMDVLRTWASPNSGIVYPVDLILHTTVDEIALVHLYADHYRPWFVDQEVVLFNPVNSYWEGLVHAEVAARPPHGQEPKFEAVGRGYMELNHFNA